MNKQKIAAILGVGPGLGTAPARRFAREGFAVGLMARSVDKLEAIQAEIAHQGDKALAFPVDATNPTLVASAFTQVRGSGAI